MTTYKGINGFAVQSVASDPSPLDEGQVWYNNATYAFKLATLSTVGTFASGGNMNTAQPYAVGTQNATLGFGNPVTESYNGTSWTSLPAAISPTRDGLAGAGTQTAGLGFGGYTTVRVATTEEYSDPTFTTKTITTS